MFIKRIKDKQTNITIKELKYFNKRFPPEFYQIYSLNESFKEKKIYKIITKDKKNKKYNIIIIKDIINLCDETIIDVLENYKDRDIIFCDDSCIEHNSFYNIFDGLNILFFNWKKNNFYYNDKKSGSHFTNIYEKLKLIYYLKHKTDPFILTPQTNTPTLSFLEKESSPFPT